MEVGGEVEVCFVEPCIYRRVSCLGRLHDYAGWYDQWDCQDIINICKQSLDILIRLNCIFSKTIFMRPSLSTLV